MRIVLVDDHPLFREGVAQTLSAEPDMQVVAEATTADQAVRAAQAAAPDVVLLDITIPGGGLNAAHTLARTLPDAKLIMLTASEEEDDVLSALKGGARGYILKGVSGRELVQVVRAVYGGSSYVTPGLAAMLLAEMPRRAPPAPTPLERLTGREREILQQVRAGHSNKEIAARLCLSEKTVKHHMTTIMEKLQVRNRTEAALQAAAFM